VIIVGALCYYCAYIVWW